MQILRLAALAQDDDFVGVRFWYPTQNAKSAFWMGHPLFVLGWRKSNRGSLCFLRPLRGLRSLEMTGHLGLAGFAQYDSAVFAAEP